MANPAQLRTIERNGYTLCETFEGCTISLHRARYYVHDAEGFLTALPAADSRAEARKLIRERLVH